MLQARGRTPIILSPPFIATRWVRFHTVAFTMPFRYIPVRKASLGIADYSQIGHLSIAFNSVSPLQTAGIARWVAWIRQCRTMRKISSSPFLRMDIKQLCSGGIGIVRCIDRAAGQPMLQQISIGGFKTLDRGFSSPFSRFTHFPGILRYRKIREKNHPNLHPNPSRPRYLLCIWIYHISLVPQISSVQNVVGSGFTAPGLQKFLSGCWCQDMRSVFWIPAFSIQILYRLDGVGRRSHSNHGIPMPAVLIYQLLYAGSVLRTRSARPVESKLPLSPAYSGRSPVHISLSIIVSPVNDQAATRASPIAGSFT